MSDATPDFQRGTADERAFVAAVAATPHDLTPRLVFADWLDERGRTNEAAVLRDPAAMPVLTPTRVLPHWGAYLSGATVVFVQTEDGPLSELTRIRIEYPRRNDQAFALYEKLESHRLACHWFRVSPNENPHPGVLVLTDAEAHLAGIDRLAAAV